MNNLWSFFFSFFFHLPVQISRMSDEYEMFLTSKFRNYLFPLWDKINCNLIDEIVNKKEMYSVNLLLHFLRHRYVIRVIPFSREFQIPEYHLETESAAYIVLGSRSWRDCFVGSRTTLEAQLSRLPSIIFTKDTDIQKDVSCFRGIEIILIKLTR